MKIATHRLSLNDGNSSKFTFDCVPKYRIHFLYRLYAVFFPTSCAFVERWNGEQKNTKRKHTRQLNLRDHQENNNNSNGNDTTRNIWEWNWSLSSTRNSFYCYYYYFYAIGSSLGFFISGQSVQRVSTFQLENSNDWLCIKHNSTPTKWMVYELHWTKMKQWIW